VCLARASELLNTRNNEDASVGATHLMFADMSIRMRTIQDALRCNDICDLLSNATLNELFWDGNRTLHLAVRYSSPSTVESLIRLGSAVDLRGGALIHGQTPLQLSVELGYTATATALLRSGADCDAVDSVCLLVLDCMLL